MNTKEKAKQQGALLKRLREEHKDTVSRTQALLKEQKEIRRQICQHIRAEPKAVPEIAGLTGIEANQILWQLMAMKKYGLVVETGMCDEYYLYQMAEAK